jgi:hypothetical protein
MTEPRIERLASLASPDGLGLLRTRNSFINDGRQIFIKLSYLFRY